MCVSKVIIFGNLVFCMCLVMVSFDYIDFGGVICQGSVVVFDVLVLQVEVLFGELLLCFFLLVGVQGLEVYDGDDQCFMVVNNSLVFNGWFMIGGGGWFKYVYGVVIDINLLQNFYVSKVGSFEQEVLLL